MTKRAILNTTSRKKRNTMLGFTNHPGPNNTTVPPAVGRTLFSATEGPHVCIWNATAMDLNDASTSREAARTSTSCFMRGLNLKDTFVFSDATSWYHRRIVFTLKSLRFQLADTSTNVTFIETSNGMQRLVNADGPHVNIVDDLLFKGTRNIDWNDRHIAALDNRACTILSDKKRTFNSGAGSYARNLNQWIPFNKNLVYNDDEAGDQETTTYLSTAAKPGMGDAYVVDIITPAISSGSGQMSWQPSATLYWHER